MCGSASALHGAAFSPACTAWRSTGLASDFVHPDVSTATGLADARAGAALARRSARACTAPSSRTRTSRWSLHFRAATSPGRLARRRANSSRRGPTLERGTLRSCPAPACSKLLPNIDWNKGSAVEWILERVARTSPSRGRLHRRRRDGRGRFRAVRRRRACRSPRPTASPAPTSPSTAPREVEALLSRCVADRSVVIMRYDRLFR